MTPAMTVALIIKTHSHCPEGLNE